jgi:hypothetical protein
MRKTSNTMAPVFKGFFDEAFEVIASCAPNEYDEQVGDDDGFEANSRGEAALVKLLSSLQEVGSFSMLPRTGLKTSELEPLTGRI